LAIKRNGLAISQHRNPAEAPQNRFGMRMHWSWRQLDASLAPDIAI